MKGFELHRQELLRSRTSASVVLMAIPAYLALGALDWYFAPEFWFTFFMIRVSTSLLFGLILLVVSKTGRFENHSIVPICHLITLTLGLGIGFMTFKTGGFTSPYYAGLNWITLGSLAFWPCLPWERLVVVLTIYGPFLLLEAIFDRTPFEVTSLVSATFMVGTCALSLISNLLSMKSLREEFRLRSELEDLVIHKEEIIARKSTEVANLKTLAKQFSPAVIEAIETRAISLDERHRKHVAIIFIDVAGSTERSNQIDHNDYQKAMDLFFDLAIKKLLARNITVANFMGDGLMAIANAPYPLVDYEREAFETALEIVKETMQKQRIFRQYWRDDFKVRVGISSGFANVGFFPNSDFGVYTAIGETVNLAARLCSSTESSTVATTKGILAAAEVSLGRCNIKRGGSINSFKGFSGHDLEYFIASPKAESVLSAESGLCPLCNHPLDKGVDLGDCILIKCRNCQYSDIEAIVSLPLKVIPKNLAS